MLLEWSMYEAFWRGALASASYTSQCRFSSVPNSRDNLIAWLYGQWLSAHSYIAFPVIAASFLGPSASAAILDNVLLKSFVDYLTAYESAILHGAVKQSSDEKFPPRTEAKLIEILSRLGCRELPTPLNIKRLIVSIAKQVFLGKPLGALYAINSGVPKPYLAFFGQLSVDRMFDLYKSLNATTSAVLRLV